MLNSVKDNEFIWSVYNPALSFTTFVGCITCSIVSDVSSITPPTGNDDGSTYSYEYSGKIMTDQFCLFFNPESSSCVKNFGFFAFNAFNEDVGNIYGTSYLGLAPPNELNGPSFMKTLNQTGRMLNYSLSW
jgi:hypothetical protein